MPSDAKQIIDTQREDWNRVAPGWEKWDEKLDRNLAFVNYRLIADARLRPGQSVLDLGSGTGYPAILAAQAVSPGGKVIGLDLAEAMLDRAQRKANALKLKNLTFRTADVSALPFEAGAFDAVISRFCLMFLPDIPKAVGEIARVLKPGGYVAAAVWSVPDKNAYLRLPMDVIKQFVELPPPDPDAPGIFPLGKPGDLKSMIERAGLMPLADEEFAADSITTSADEYVTSLLDIAAPIQTLLGKLPDAKRSEVIAAIRKAAEAYRRDDGVSLPMTIRFLAARKAR
jgi:ubiquinone/menaquinone biosynthesis C-methylase UbiE